MAETTLLDRLLQDWDKALKQAADIAFSLDEYTNHFPLVFELSPPHFLCASSEFGLGERDTTRRYKPKQALVPPLPPPKAKGKQAAVPLPPKPEPEKPVIDLMDQVKGAKKKQTKRKAEEEVKVNDRPLKRAHTEGAAQVAPGTNNRTEAVLEPLSLILEKLHAIYSFLYMLMRPDRVSRVLMQYTRQMLLRTLDEKAVDGNALEANKYYKHYVAFAMPFIDDTWNIAIRNAYSNGTNSLLEHTGLNAVFGDILKPLLLPQIENEEERLVKVKPLNDWITEYMADPYIGEGGVTNSHVYTWSNLIIPEKRPMLVDLARDYMDFIYDRDPSGNDAMKIVYDKWPKDLAEADRRNHLVAQKLLEEPMVAARRYFPEPTAIPEDYGNMSEYILTGLVGEIAARMLENRYMAHVSIDDLLQAMPIEFVIRLMLDHPHLVNGTNEAVLKDNLRSLLGNTQGPNAVYGHIEDRLKRIWDRVQSVYYLNPDDIWANWAKVRNARGLGPYEYQWSIIIPLLAAELRETTDQGVIRPMGDFLRGGYLACDPGTGKTLLTLVVLVLGNLITGNRNPTMIVLPPALVDEWIGAWKKFFRADIRKQFPLFVYDRYEARLEGGGGGDGSGLVNENPILEPGKNRLIYPKSLPPNAILLVKRKQMEKFSGRYYDKVHTEGQLRIRDKLAQDDRQTRADKNKMIDLLKVPWQRVIVDESHTFNNRLNLAFEGLYNIIETRPQRPFVYLLSGTPVVYNVIDLTSQLRLMGFKLSKRPEFTAELRNKIETQIRENQIRGAEPVPTAEAALYDWIDAELMDQVIEPPPQAQPGIDWSGVPLYDQVGDMMSRVASKVRGQILAKIFQYEFDIFFVPDGNGNFFLNKEKLFGYFYQLFVDDTPQYQRGVAPHEEPVKRAPISMTTDARTRPERCLFDMLYPFMSVKSSREYNLPKSTKEYSPFARDAEWRDGDYGRDGNFEENFADTDDEMVNLADELFARHVFYEQWKNQFVHKAIVTKYSLQDHDPGFTFTLMGDPDRAKPKPPKKTYDLNPEAALESDDEEPAGADVDDSEDEDADDEAVRRPPPLPRRGQTVEDYYIEGGSNQKANLIRIVRSFRVRGQEPPHQLEDPAFAKAIQSLHSLVAIAVFSAPFTLPGLHKLMAPQHIRDAQMVIAYDWRLINKIFYKQLILAALRTAAAIMDNQVREYSPIGGNRQPLYRLWYALGVTRLIEIAEVLIQHSRELFDPVLYLVAQQSSVINLNAKEKNRDGELVPVDEDKPHITKFVPALYRPEVDRYVNQMIRDLSTSHVPFGKQKDWYAQTLIGATLETVEQILKKETKPGIPPDKIIIYAQSDNLLSYVSFLMSMYGVARPYMLQNKVKLDERFDSSKETDPGPFFVHAKSAYIGIENQLISYFKFMPSVRILLITYNKGGVGLNLQVANHEILLTSSLRYTEMRQARDRVYRNNQKKQVFIWQMEMKIPDDPIFHIPESGDPPQIGVDMLAIPEKDDNGNSIMPIGWDWHFNDTNTWWTGVMYLIASRQWHQPLNDETWWTAFMFTYRQFANRPIMPVHQLVTTTRTEWQRAHRQFYPVHHLGNAANPEQSQRLAFARAIFQHEVSVLLGLV